jgi:hypothetical protein
MIPFIYSQQITKADRNACHVLRRKGKARATLRRLSSTVLLINVDIFVSLNIDFSYYAKGSYKTQIEG